MSLVGISTCEPGNATVRDTKIRAMDSTEGPEPGEYCDVAKPTSTLRMSAITRRSTLIARSGFFFSTVVVGVASIGVSSPTHSVEHTKIRRAIISFRSFSAINVVAATDSGLYGNPCTRGGYRYSTVVYCADALVENTHHGGVLRWEQRAISMRKGDLVGMCSHFTFLKLLESGVYPHISVSIYPPCRPENKVLCCCRNRICRQNNGLYPPAEALPSSTYADSQEGRVIRWKAQLE